jgi:hypothetical protein
LHLQTTNVSTLGAKVRSGEALEVGTLARLHFEPPTGHPVDVEATVSRADVDGLVFAFNEVLDEEFKSSLESEGLRPRPLVP